MSLGETPCPSDNEGVFWVGNRLSDAAFPPSLLVPFTFSPLIQCPNDCAQHFYDLRDLLGGDDQWGGEGDNIASDAD
jgi:hypothetical protein